MPAELTNYARRKSWLHYKWRNEILKEKSKDKILNSSTVSIFFDKSFFVSSPNKILAIETCGNLSAMHLNKTVTNEPTKCVHLP